MYDADQVLRYIDHNTAAVLAAAAIACVGGTVQYVEGVRRGFADRSHAIPLGTNLYIFAHDVTYIAMYDRWFGAQGHWFNQLFWVFILPFALLELVVFSQLFRYSRRELLPGLTSAQCLLALGACQVGAFFLFWFLRSLGPDPLYIVSFTTTIVVSNLFYIPMTLRRGSRRGQSVLLGSGLLCLSVGWSLVMVQLSPAFRSPAWLGLLGSNALLALANLLVLVRFPAWQASGARPSHTLSQTSSAPQAALRASLPSVALADAGLTNRVPPATENS